MNIFITILFGVSLLLAHNPVFSAPQKVIFDTDMAGDWDDVGAMATLHALANLGEAKILGMGINTGGKSAKWNATTLDIINTYYGKPDIPIGMAKDGVAMEHYYSEWLAKQGFPYQLDATEEVISMYRRILSKQPDSSVVLISVGYLNNLNDLLLSPADKHSPLNGRELIKKKVRFLSAMAGVYPDKGAEANMQDWRGDAQRVINNFPVPILFTSSQVGDYATGSSLLNTPKNNPVRAIYEYQQKQRHPHTINHPSFDQTAVLVAIRDVNDYFKVTPDGTNVITLDKDRKTFNKWNPDPQSGHRYFTHTHINTVIDEVNKLMAMPPSVQKTPE